MYKRQASIFADAEDEIKAVDIAWDAFIQEITLTGVRLFVDDELISTGEDGGRVVPTGVAEDMFYRKVEGKEAKNYIETFSPNIRTEPLLAALNASLAEMGDACGFGQNLSLIHISRLKEQVYKLNAAETFSRQSESERRRLESEAKRLSDANDLLKDCLLYTSQVGYDNGLKAREVAHVER